VGSAPGARRRNRRRQLRRRRRAVALALVLVVVFVVATIGSSGHRSVDSASEIARADIAAAKAISPLRGRIVALAESQVGYRTDPRNTYCNKFSAHWVSGADDCGNDNLDEQWCADFAAWVWQKAGVEVTYQYVNGDLNASSASFYEWGNSHGTWHRIGSGYIPHPGDVAVYGLNTATLVAQHVAVVVSYAKGSRGPDAVNGDGDRTGFSAVEVGNDEYKADISPTQAAPLAGYVAPS
jgi:hypothetical protein